MKIYPIQMFYKKFRCQLLNQKASWRVLSVSFHDLRDA